MVTALDARQFDVFPNPDPGSVESHPYLIVLQADALHGLNTRVVAPLIAPRQIPLFERLMPEVDVQGRRYVIDVTNIGVVRCHVLQNAVANLEPRRYHIIGAIDLVFSGI